MAMGAGMMGQWLRRQAQAYWARLAANSAPPGAADLAEARAFGRRLAAHLTGRAPPREIDLADLAAR